MGVTIHYRGSLDDIERVEDFEDRVLDLALALGASARIWRSVSDQVSDRIVRGLIVNLAPGQDPTSLLISPEGRLVSLMDIEAAEYGEPDEPPWCFVKTQFGPVQGHVALVELLNAIQREFMTNLEVNDEGGYWETRDIAELTRRVKFLESATGALATGLSHFGLSPEAAEDPHILAARMQRVAELVHRTISRPSEHPQVEFDESDEWAWTPASEAQWDAEYRERRRKQERLHRAIEERLAAGESHNDAFENAMRDIGIVDLPGEEDAEDGFDKSPAIDDRQDADEPWRESLEDEVPDEDDDVEAWSRRQHPLQRRAMDLMSRLHRELNDVDENASHQVQILLSGAGDIVGGLAQTFCRIDDEDGVFGIHPVNRGLSIVQLKRALRGAAFACGSLYSLSREAIFDDRTFKELRSTIESLRDDILSTLQEFRGDIAE